jgi:hypothetical protein
MKVEEHGPDVGSLHQLVDSLRRTEPYLAEAERLIHVVPALDADLVGCHVDVWSQVGVGTEVDLRIPAAKAYTTVRPHRRVWRFAKKTGTNS